MTEHLEFLEIVRMGLWAYGDSHGLGGAIAVIVIGGLVVLIWGAIANMEPKKKPKKKVKKKKTPQLRKEYYESFQQTEIK